MVVSTSRVSDRHWCPQCFFAPGAPTPATGNQTPQQKQDMQLSDDYTGGRDSPPPPAQRGREAILEEILRNVAHH